MAHRIHIKDIRSDLIKLKTENKNFTAVFVDNYLEISDQELVKSDFEKCDFTAAQLTKVKITDCTYTNSDFSNARFGGCVISDSNFNSCKFNSTAIISKGNEISQFINSSFHDCKFSRLALDYTLFKECKFLNCIFEKVEFNGSRFKDVSFSGRISDSFFRRHIRHLPTYNLLDKLTGKTVSPSQYENEMINIDFSKCELDGVAFLGGINLEKCIFPMGDRYLFIKNRELTYKKAMDYISAEWEGEDKRLANIVFKSFFLSKPKEGQKNDLVDFDVITEQVNGNFSSKIKAVLEKYNN